MWIADAHRGHRESVDDLGSRDVDLAEILLDDGAVENPGVHRALAHDHLDAFGSRARRKPRGGDPRAVSRELGPRAVRIPDRDLDAIVRRGEHLEHAVRPPCELDCVPRVQPSVARLRDNVCVTERAPRRGLHQPPVRPVGRRR